MTLHSRVRIRNDRINPKGIFDRVYKALNPDATDPEPFYAEDEVSHTWDSVWGRGLPAHLDVVKYLTTIPRGLDLPGAPEGNLEVNLDTTYAWRPDPSWTPGFVRDRRSPCDHLHAYLIMLTRDEMLAQGGSDHDGWWYNEYLSTWGCFNAHDFTDRLQEFGDYAVGKMYLDQSHKFNRARSVTTPGRVGSDLTEGVTP